MNAKATIDELIDKMHLLGDTLAFVDHDIWLGLQAEEGLCVQSLGTDAAIFYRGVELRSSVA